jgi:hypothetical protein
MVLSPEERALAMSLADRLIDLYEQRDAALSAGDADRVYELQTQIDTTAQNGKRSWPATTSLAAAPVLCEGGLMAADTALPGRTTDHQARAELRVLIEELEARACDMENGT